MLLRFVVEWCTQEDVAALLGPFNITAFEIGKKFQVQVIGMVASIGMLNEFRGYGMSYVLKQ